jgi:acylglycerol lipase
MTMHHEGNFVGAKGASIYYQSWAPETPPRAVIVIVHGAAEHGGRYERLAGYLVPHGYAVVAQDHPGHGHSDGKRGHVDRFDDFTKALQELCRQAAGDFGDVPQILLGHSMGGLISTHYLLEHQDDFIGCVLSGPAIKTDIEPGALQMGLIRLLSFFVPKMGALQLDAEGVSRDPAEVELYRNDPLNHNGKMSARLVAELFKAMKHVQANVKGIRLPLLMLHGGADVMASPEGSRFLAAEVGSKDKTLEIYPGLFHEIFNEPEREQVFADVLNWCDALLEKSGKA